jgi:hypothetical protein
MTTLGRLATEFGNTESPEQAQPLIEEVDELFTDVMLWQAPTCAQELQVNIALAVENLASAMRAVIAGDVEGFNRNYGTYAIAVETMNKEYERLLQAAED